MSDIVGIPWAAIPQVWDEVEPFVVRCFKKSREHRYGADDVHNMLQARDLQLWVTAHESSIDLIVLTQVVCYPRAKECNIFMVCGTLPDNWKDILAELTEWAKSVGCQYMSAMSRRGFAAHAGWDNRETYVVGEL